MATDEGIQLPTSREDSGGIWFCASDPDLTKPAAATYLTCMINVPFAHRLLKASLSVEDIDNVGAVTVDLMQADPGDAKAGTSVAQLDDTALASTADVASQLDFTIGDADKVATAAGRRYHLKVVGTNAGDGVEGMALSICVEPVTRSTL